MCEAKGLEANEPSNPPPGKRGRGLRLVVQLLFVFKVHIIRKKQSEIMKNYDFHGFPVLGCSFAELVETWSVPCHGDIDCVCRNKIKI